MRINLLSEVAAYAEGSDTDLLAAMQPMHRLFVAVLALSAGRSVGMDQLEERLWGDFLPADPRARLHSCASKVRAALRNENVRDDLLAVQAGGYCLRVHRQSIDVHRFRTKAAEILIRADEPGSRASLAREALLEWAPATTQLYGPEPLAGLPGQWAANYRLTLRREHRDVLIGLLAAELRHGAAARVLTEFAKLADADEVAREDEQLTSLLMHAYYACGRQAEAFRAYQRTVESLRRKGVETGRELRMMEKKIRNQDPGLDYPHPAVIAPRDLVPADEGYSGGQGSDAPAAPLDAEGPEDSGSGMGKREKHKASYSQRNIGHTVIANQGTQHINVGGSDA
jgi:DNA-binding SARP family transcriptional activator